MADIVLCDHCAEIDFAAAGLRRPNDPSYNFFAMDEIPFQQVLDNAEVCSFCKMVATFFFAWAEANYDGFNRHSLPVVRVDYAAIRSKTIEEEQGVANAPSLFKICANFIVKEPVGDGWLGLSMELQKCAIEYNDVASVFKLCPSRGWPENGELYLGRKRPLLADCRLFERWKDWCIETHKESCGPWFTGEKPWKIRLIDVHQMCIVDKDGGTEWVALSYLWGDANFLTLQKNYVDEFRQPGFLSQQNVPKTIFDAMQVTAAIGETYLWVDSLCIVQDDPFDKLEYIPRMASIYGQSKLTIIDAAGINANSGLPGARPNSRKQVQKPFVAKGVSLVQTLDPINHTGQGLIPHSPWTQRAWTFQEGLLAPRILLFTPEQVYWHCNLASWREDGSWEGFSTPTVYQHYLRDEFRNIAISAEDSTEEIYRQLVEEYSKRSLTYGSDFLDAFSGMITALEHASGLRFLWGLPMQYFGAALTWPAHDEGGQVKRRTSLCKFQDSSGNIVTMPFPSWSWIGWEGKIHFDEVFGILTSRHAGIVFHRILPDKSVQNIEQHSKFKDKYSEWQSHDSNDREADVPQPDWRDESRVEIVTADVPEAVFTRHLSSITIPFWSSTVLATVQYTHDDAVQHKKAKLIHAGREVEVFWSHIPSRPETLQEEDIRLIIVGRDTLSRVRRREELVAVVTDVNTHEGLSYRRGSLSIRESLWNGFDGKRWQMFFLA